jgi:hypothetical protein
VSATHARLIILLLCAILAVLLFGREPVLGSTHILLWIAAACVVLAIVWVFGWAVLVEAPKELLSELRGLRRSGKPWLAEAILFTGLPFGIIWIAGLMATKYLGYVQHQPYTNMVGLVWFVMCPLWLVAMFTRWVRSLFRRESTPDDPNKGNLKKDFMVEDMIDGIATALASRFSIEHQDDTEIEVRDTRTGTTFAFRLVNGNPVGPYRVAPGLSRELRSGAPIDMDDHDAVEALAATARNAAAVLLKRSARSNLP